MITSPKFLKKTLQDYEVISVIGNGSFGTCYKVRDKETDTLYAWKAIDYEDLDDGKLESLASEINVLRQLRHPNIVQYYHHLNSHEAKTIFIIMEWCEGGDLAQLIAKSRVQRKRLQEQYIWRVLLQICQALQVCHSKLKQGTVLHRDIKPANVFLDAYGNAKLGDFGLARVVQRNKCFAETFVGTPYYMSPELIKGSRYDCKSDVWALGCLTYEMATLRRPFRGGKMSQLSLNISKGQYSNISDVYSRDLQEIIRLMLEVSEEQRPSVQMVAIHQNLLRNITNLESNLEALIEAEPTFFSAESRDTPRTRLEYSFSDTVTSNDFTLDEDRQRIFVSEVFTPDIRTGIFTSVNRKIYSRTLQKSDPELYKNSRPFDNGKQADKCPQAVAPNVFNDHIQQRLHAIRAHEVLLQQKEESLCALEQKLNKMERRLQEFQSKLDKKQSSLDSKIKSYKQSYRKKLVTQSNAASKRISMTSSVFNKFAEPQDETYCTIEPQDTMPPTVAKLNLATLPTGKALSTLRKVTFQSPKQIITYDIENDPQKRRSQTFIKSSVKLLNSIGSSSEGSSSDSTTQRRKSLLSILGIKRNVKDMPKESVLTDITPHPNLTQPDKFKAILSKTESEKLTNIWTKENKRAAFDLLAAMNAADGNKDVRVSERNSTLTVAKDKFKEEGKIRQSMREPKRTAFQRSHNRQSLKVLPVAM